MKKLCLNDDDNDVDINVQHFPVMDGNGMECIVGAGEKEEGGGWWKCREWWQIKSIHAGATDDN